MMNNMYIGFITDPIEAFNTKKDSSFAMMLAAQARGWMLYYMQQKDLYVRDGIVYADMQALQVKDQLNDYYQIDESITQPLHQLDAVLMRKDPPFDMEYIYSTYLLELAAKQGLLVVNRADSIRSANEKFFTTEFPEYCPETLVTRDMQRIKQFIKELGHIVVKPLDGMGGAMVFQIKQGDPNTNVILETITQYGTQTIIAQRFLPEYKQGDKRILIINGKPFPHALARIPAEGEGRANLAAGGEGLGVDLSDKEFEICERLTPRLQEMGLMFVGLDVIGDYITEINVTSPTCIRELDKLYSADIAGLLMDEIEIVLQNTMKNRQQ